MGFKDNLQYLRGSHNMTQEQLAMLIGVSRQSVSKWESEKAYPEMDKLLMLCDMFGVSLDDLVMGDVRNGIAMSANHVEDALPKAPMPEMEGSALPQDITGYEEHMRKIRPDDSHGSVSHHLRRQHRQPVRFGQFDSGQQRCE